MKKLLLLVFTLFLFSCSGGNGFKHGQIVYVSEQCIAAINEDAYKEMTRLCNRRDEYGLSRMESEGLIIILNSGKRGEVVDMSFGKVKIRLSNGNEYWCANEFVE